MQLVLSNIIQSDVDTNIIVEIVSSDIISQEQLSKFKRTLDVNSTNSYTVVATTLNGKINHTSNYKTVYVDYDDSLIDGVTYNPKFGRYSFFYNEYQDI